MTWVPIPSLRSSFRSRLGSSLRLGALLALVASGACSTDSASSDAAGGAGGGHAAGGSGGTSTGGAGGGGAGGGGGASGAGGGGAGSTDGGGSAGSPGAGGSGGSRDAGGADAASDAGPADAPADSDGPPGSGVTLDDCFKGVRMAMGTGQIATKASADGTIKMRIALETADRFGTAGTVPWEPIRFGLETPTARVCLTDEGALATDYVDGHHNCNDTMTFTSGNRRYEIQHPDTAAMRNEATLTVYEGATVVIGPVKLTTTTCTTNVATGVCRSGGPC